MTEGTTKVIVTLDGEETEFVMDQENVVLDAALDEDLDAPHSCRGGICSTCLALITEGKAEMRKNQILTDSEVEEGYVLTRSEEHTSELQSRGHLVCRLLLEKKNHERCRI